MQAQAEIGGTEGGGLHRLTLLDDDKRIREWFMAQMEAESLDVTVDEFDNMFRYREGTNTDTGTVLMGPHLNLQPYGGIYDGSWGSLPHSN